jgi:ATP-binding cassette subfamily B multidrug efflux pump
MSEEKKETGNSQKSSDWRLILRIYRLASPYKWRLLLAIVLTLGFAVTGPLIPKLIQVAVDEKIMSNDSAGLNRMALIIFGLYLLNTLMMLTRTWVAGILAQDVIRDLRNRVFHYISRMKLKYLDRTPVGTLITRTVSDLQTISDFFTEGAIAISGDILNIAVIILMMFSVDWKLSLVSLSVLPFLLIAAYIFKEKVKISFQDVRTHVARLNSFVQEHLTGMQIVQIFNRERMEEKKFRKINADHRDAHIRSVLYYAIFFPVVEIITALSIGLLIWYGINTMIDPQPGGPVYEVGVLVSFIMYINMFFRPVRQIADKFNSMQMGMVAADRVFRLVDREDDLETGGDYISEKIRGNVRFDQVWFAYNREEWVLRDLSFEVKEGKTLALVGTTGAGKTSVINLISRFYDIQKGQVLLDGKNINDYDLYALRNNIAVVLQDVFLFSGSIAENIRLFNPEITDSQIADACKSVGADKFIEKLPGKYNYKVMERGGSLSVGQRQLISFARTLAFNPRILILDEATSSVDSETEELIQKAIALLMQGRTSIVIAHRLSTIQHADEIIVLEKGKILEQGSHRQLMENRAFYSDMYRNQYEETLKEN